MIASWRLKTKHQEGCCPGQVRARLTQSPARINEHSSSPGRVPLCLRYFAPALASSSATFGWLSRLAYIMAE